MSGTRDNGRGRLSVTSFYLSRHRSSPGHQLRPRSADPTPTQQLPPSPDPSPEPRAADPGTRTMEAVSSGGWRGAEGGEGRGSVTHLACSTLSAGLSALHCSRIEAGQPTRYNIESLAASRLPLMVAATVQAPRRHGHAHKPLNAGTPAPHRLSSQILNCRSPSAVRRPPPAGPAEPRRAFLRMVGPALLRRRWLVVSVRRER